LKPDPEEWVPPDGLVSWTPNISYDIHGSNQLLGTLSAQSLAAAGPAYVTAGVNALAFSGIVRTPTTKSVSIKVVEGAWLSEVPHNAVAIKDEDDSFIVRAETVPDNNDAWQGIDWSQGSESGSAVPGLTNNYRQFSCATSRMVHIVAQFGNENDSLDVWVKCLSR
jgi:hypothetical protein